jgi:hypothetical protein
MTNSPRAKRWKDEVAWFAVLGEGGGELQQICELIHGKTRLSND